MKLWQKLNQARETTSASTFWIFFAICCSLILGQWLRLSVSQFALYPHDFLILIWLFTQLHNLGKVLNTWLKNFKKNTLLAISMVWIVLGMLIALLSSWDMTPFLYLGRVLYYLIFLATVSQVFTKKKGSLIIFSVIVGVGMMVLGLAQYWLLPDTRYLFAYGWDEHYFRLIGPLLDPNYTGLVLVTTFWVILSLKKHFSSWVLIGTGLSIGTALVLTYSRASFLAFLISLIVYGVANNKKLTSAWKKSLLGVIGAVLLGIGVLLLAPKPGGEGIDLLRTTSIYARVTTSIEFLETLQPWQWLIGAGFYTRPIDIHSATSHARVPDNLEVLIVFSTGFGGVVLLALLLKKYQHRCRQFSPQLWGILTAVLVHAQFNNSVFEPFVLLIVGLAVLGESDN